MEVQLWIVGDGECESKLKTITSGLGITGSVDFVGKVGNDELPDYYAAADLFVAPSIVDQGGDTEGQGVVIIEAMAAGLPGCCQQCGGYLRCYR